MVSFHEGCECYTPLELQSLRLVSLSSCSVSSLLVGSMPSLRRRQVSTHGRESVWRRPSATSRQTPRLASQVDVMSSSAS